MARSARVPDFAALVADLEALQTRVTLGGNHQYRANGKHSPGVTTVIKTMDAPKLDDWKVRVQTEGTARAAFANPPLENEPLEGYVARLKKLGEAEKEHERLADAAAIVGTDVHALIEHAIKGMLGRTVARPVVCEEALYRFAGWKEWAADVGLKPLATESRLYHAEHDYCGTLDLLALIKGRPVVIDWKPSAELYPERRLQSAAYRKALVHAGWPEMDGAVVCVPRDGGDIRMIPTDPPGPELDATFDAFLALLQVYRWQREGARAARKRGRAA